MHADTTIELQQIQSGEERKTFFHPEVLFSFVAAEKSLPTLVWGKNQVTKISLFFWLIRHVLHRVKGNSGKGDLIFPTR